MHEWGKGELHSGSKKGPVVKSQKQALAIGYSEAKKSSHEKALEKHYSNGNQRKMHYDTIKYTTKKEHRGPSYEKVNRTYPKD